MSVQTDLNRWRSWKMRMTLAFTLMSNHVHELLACMKAEQADKTIKLYKKLISTFLRRKYGLSQTLHRTRDCISVIDSIQYLKNCIAYILRNAVCARICSKPEDYRWSSYGCYFSDKRKKSVSIPVSELTYTEKRRLLKTGMDLDYPWIIRRIRRSRKSLQVFRQVIPILSGLLQWCKDGIWTGLPTYDACKRPGYVWDHQETCCQPFSGKRTVRVIIVREMLYP